MPPGSDYQACRRHTRWRIFDACSGSRDPLATNVCCTPGYPSTFRLTKAMPQDCLKDAVETSSRPLVGIGELNEWWKQELTLSRMPALELASRAGCAARAGAQDNSRENMERVEFTRVYAPCASRIVT